MQTALWPSYHVQKITVRVLSINRAMNIAQIQFRYFDQSPNETNVKTVVLSDLIFID